ncbi:MAG: carboxylate-amine ligase [Gammaproteobacteria bacterium]|nr:carboxylate-amine ligase [Gammaproteobacteria bacterium]
MKDADLSITLGIEEEFFLVDPDTRDMLADPDPAIFEYCKAHAGAHKAVPEMLRSQIETNTRVCHSVREVREALCETRGLVVEAAASRGAAVIAASTHPFAVWQAQLTTPRKRYEDFEMTYQEAVRRYLVGGMHVHAGFGDADARIRVMTAMRRYLPILLALSTSSPFNQGNNTGYKSYRQCLIGVLPRTSLPNALYSAAEYEALLDNYRRMHFISDGSELWWDIRPSQHYPTVELRICDLCTLLEDALCIVALYACLVRMLMRQHYAGELPGEPLTEIIAENRWLAQRYGVLAFLGNTADGGRSDIGDLVAQLVETLGEDAEALDCERELRHALDIVANGSGADRQTDHFRLRILEGDSDREALVSVVDQILAETRRGI